MKIPRMRRLCAKRYPHMLSGGMRQRVMIAMALAARPSLLIADEPTTALDVTVQAEILALIRSLQKETGMGVLFITHDMGVVSEMADWVAVMYAGHLVEYTLASELFTNPKHPYSIGLINSIPSLDDAVEKLYAIPGNVPMLDELPSGCPSTRGARTRATSAAGSARTWRRLTATRTTPLPAGCSTQRSGVSSVGRNADMTDVVLKVDTSPSAIP